MRGSALRHLRIGARARPCRRQHASIAQHGRPCCRRRASASRTSCCPPCRRASPAPRWRRRRDTRGPADAAARSACRARRRARPPSASRSTSMHAVEVRLSSMTRASPTVWPHCEVPAPRGRTGTRPPPRDLHRGPHVVCARHDHAQRRHLVDRRVGRVASAARASNRTSPAPRGQAAQGNGWHVRGRSASGEESGRCAWVRLPRASRGQAGRRAALRMTRSGGELQPAGRHFLQIPGPTNVPDRVLRAIDPSDHRPSRPRVPALGKTCSRA